MYAVYLLHSIKHNQIYIGYTTNLIERFKSHNELAKKGHTIKYRPWTVVHIEFFQDKTDAMKREKQLKSSKGRVFCHDVISKFIQAN